MRGKRERMVCSGAELCCVRLDATPCSRNSTASTDCGGGGWEGGGEGGGGRGEGRETERTGLYNYIHLQNNTDLY